MVTKCKVETIIDNVNITLHFNKDKILIAHKLENNINTEITKLRVKNNILYKISNINSLESDVKDVIKEVKFLQLPMNKLS